MGASTGAAGASPAVVVFLAAAEAVEAGNAGIMDSETDSVAFTNHDAVPSATPSSFAASAIASSAALTSASAVRIAAVSAVHCSVACATSAEVLLRRGVRRLPVGDDGGGGRITASVPSGHRPILVSVSVL